MRILKRIARSFHPDNIRRTFWTAEGRLLEQSRHRPVFDAVKPASQGAQRSALLVYLPKPFHLPAHHPEFHRHQNLGQTMLIVEALAEFGYRVDVVDFRDRKFRPDAVYDLLLSHRLDCTGLEDAIGPRTLKVYLSSGMNHSARNRAYARRLAYLRERRGIDLPAGVIDVEDMPFLKIADAIVGFGNPVVMDSWKQAFSGPVYGFNNYGVLTDCSFRRDWAEARRHFLFFGSRQQVAKGLDLLLDFFPRHPDLHLHVCGQYEKDGPFCSAFRKELFGTPNIHPHGWMDIERPEFHDLLERCAWTLLPSCSEGSPGSVTNAMSAGLIPILTREAGIDLQDFGVLLENGRVETIEETVVRLADFPVSRVVEQSRLTTEAARRDFSKEAFQSRWREILSELHRKSIGLPDVLA